MKIIKKISAGFMLSLGFLCLLVSFSTLSDLTAEDTTPEEKAEAQSAFWGGIVFGVPLTAGGGYISWGLRRQDQQEVSDRLDAIFYQMLKANNGKITVLQLAMEAKLPGKQAQEYLNQKSQEFNATFEPSDQGDISYLFHI
ncbi:MULTISPECIES: hypothetical protein [unclassified Anabaena]|uniref:hypothetical protein n=1 Tax=unclassified Anabaena TaxID=2619674 RepID=UPI0039C6780D